MKINVQFFAAILCVPLLGACAPVSLSQYEKRGLKPLDTSQIQTLVMGKEIEIESIDFNASVTFLENMTITAREISGQEDSGRWSLEPGDLLCVKFNSWFFGDQNCYRIIKDMDKILFFTQNGAIRYTGSPPKPGIETSDTKEPEKLQPNSPASSPANEPTPTAKTSKESAKDRFIRLAKNCPDCNLSGVDLSHADLIKANLAGADLSGADLSGANLRLANFAGANLSGARLQQANLPGANFTGADLSGADFSGANLIRADITGAATKNTIFSGALLESIQGKID